MVDPAKLIEFMAGLVKDANAKAVMIKLLGLDKKEPTMSNEKITLSPTKTPGQANTVTDDKKENHASYSHERNQNIIRYPYPYETSNTMPIMLDVEEPRT